MLLGAIYDLLVLLAIAQQQKQTLKTATTSAKADLTLLKVFQKSSCAPKELLTSRSGNIA
jgi:hypothetical protein